MRVKINNALSVLLYAVAFFAVIMAFGSITAPKAQASNIIYGSTVDNYAGARISVRCVNSHHWHTVYERSRTSRWSSDNYCRNGVDEFVVRYDKRCLWTNEGPYGTIEWGRAYPGRVYHVGTSYNHHAGALYRAYAYSRCNSPSYRHQSFDSTPWN